MRAYDLPSRSRRTSLTVSATIFGNSRLNLSKAPPNASTFCSTRSRRVSTRSRRASTPIQAGFDSRQIVAVAGLFEDIAGDDLFPLDLAFEHADTGLEFLSGHIYGHCWKPPSPK